MGKFNQLDDKRQRLENIIKATGVGTWEWEIQTGKVSYNDAWAKIIGYTLDELSPNIDTWKEYTHPEDLEFAEKTLNRVFSKELPYYEFELRMKHKDGHWVWILDKGEVISWSSDGKPLLMVGSHTDITHIKQQAEILLSTQILLKSSLESPKDMIILAVDKNYNYMYFNNAHKRSMKQVYNIDVNIGMNLLDCITSKIDQKIAKKNYDLALSGKSHSTIQEFGEIEKTFYESLYNPIYNDKNEIIGATAFARDVSELMSATTKIKESEEKLKIVLNSTASGIFSVDINDVCTYVNKGTLDLLGYDHEDEILGKNIHQLTHHSYEDGTSFPAKECFIVESISNGLMGSRDDIIWRKDGTWIPVSYSIYPHVVDGKNKGSVISFTDISKRNELVTNLKYERNLAQMYLNVAGVIIIVLDNQGNISLINKKGLEILEAEEKDVIGKNWFDNFLPEDNIDVIKQVFKNVFNKKDQIALIFENEILSLSGNKKIIKWYNTVLYDINGNVTGILSSGEDVTINRHNELALYESNLRFKTLFEKAPLGYQSLDINGCFREINKTWTDLLGYTKEEVLGKWFGDFLAPEYKEAFRERFEYFKKKGRIHSEFIMLHKDGHQMYIEFEGMIGYDDSHQFMQTYCTLNDITERQKVRNQLLESEKNLRIAQSIAKVGSWELNLLDNSLWASEEAFNIYEIKRHNEYLDLVTIQDMVDSDDRKKLDDALYALIQYQKPYDIDFKLHTENGAIKHINSKASLFTDSDQKPIKVIGVIHDITELKNKEIELEYINNHDYLTDLYNRRYYFEQFNLLDQPKYYPLGIMMLDVNGLKIINDAFGHAVGDSALKMLGNILRDIFEDKDIVSRIGGDEFTVLLPNTEPHKLQSYKEEIIAILKTRRIRNIELSLAVGYELKNDIHEDIDDIQKSAENQMYRHKTTEGSSVRSRAINAILLTLTNKYDTEKRHSVEVSHLCRKIGIELHLRDDEIKELEQAGLFHDIGKISIPDSILNKPDKLTYEEFEVIKSHTEIGYQILRAADEYSDLAIHALHHHERWDGKGYPSGMKGNEIPLFSRIINVVDAYEAMTADRPYRKKMSKEYAISEIIKCSGSQFDPTIAKLFVEKILEKSWT